MQPDQIEFWIDINLPPAMKKWIMEEYGYNAQTFYELGFDVAEDVFVYRMASNRKQIIIITTKDTDYISLSNIRLAGPKILHINTGNISNRELKKMFDKVFPDVIDILLHTSQTIIELKAE